MIIQWSWGVIENIRAYIDCQELENIKEGKKNKRITELPKHKWEGMTITRIANSIHAVIIKAEIHIYLLIMFALH